MTTENMKRLEPWPGYFELRSKEIEVLFKFWRPGQIENFLEIGCGLGIASSVFSDFAKSVFATDLITADKKTNTPGTERTVEFLDTQNKKNIFFFGANAVSLPFRSNCIDIVFSMSLLEHIALDKRDETVREMKRVLKENGYIVAIVPTVTERIGSALHYYADLSLRAVKKISAKISGKKIDSDPEGNNGYKTGPCGFTQRGRHLFQTGLAKLLPPIHGYYRNHFEELSNQFPLQWEGLFKRNGFEIMKTFTIRFLPFTTKAFIWLYKRSSRIEALLGDKIPFKYLGKNYCIIAKVKKSKC